MWFFYFTMQEALISESKGLKTTGVMVTIGFNRRHWSCFDGNNLKIGLVVGRLI